MTEPEPMEASAKVAEVNEFTGELEGNPEYENLMANMLKRKLQIERIHKSIVREREEKAAKIQKQNKRKRKLRKRQKSHTRKKK